MYGVSYINMYRRIVRCMKSTQLHMIASDSSAHFGINFSAGTSSFFPFPHQHETKK